MSIVQLLYIAQPWALRMNCKLKQKENQEERNAGNMTEFLVNRPVVVLVESHKLSSARTFGLRSCWFFQGKGRRNSWERERKKKQIMMKKKETKAEDRKNYIKLNKQRQTRYKIL